MKELYFTFLSIAMDSMFTQNSPLSFENETKAACASGKTAAMVIAIAIVVIMFILIITAFVLRQSSPDSKSAGSISTFLRKQGVIFLFIAVGMVAAYFYLPEVVSAIAGVKCPS